MKKMFIMFLSMLVASVSSYAETQGESTTDALFDGYLSWKRNYQILMEPPRPVEVSEGVINGPRFETRKGESYPKGTKVEQSAVATQNDNRFKEVKVGEPILFPSVPTSEELLDAIYASHDQKLLAAMGRGIADKFGVAYPLVWFQSVALYDGDYILSIFDRSGRIYPGNNPRVLVLLNKDHKVVTWGKFICEPAFGYASIAQSRLNKETYLITVNPSSRFGGELWFERYKIEPTKIMKLGEGASPYITNTAEQDAAANP